MGRQCLALLILLFLLNLLRVRGELRFSRSAFFPSLNQGVISLQQVDFLGSFSLQSADVIKQTTFDMLWCVVVFDYCGSSFGRMPSMPTMAVPPSPYASFRCLVFSLSPS